MVSGENSGQDPENGSTISYEGFDITNLPICSKQLVGRKSQNM